eukprot:gene14675-20710_t
MGNLFSSKKDTKINLNGELKEGKPNSAPSRLEGLDGMSPVKVADRRATTPPEDSTGLRENDEAPKSGKVKKIDMIGKQSDGAELAAALPAVASTAVPDEAKGWGKVFGDRAVRGLFSSDWKEREQALSGITRFLSVPEVCKHDPTAAFLATTQVLERFVKEKVAPLFHASLDVLREMLNAFCSQLPLATMKQGLDPLMPPLLNRCGNLNTRIHEASLQALLGIAGVPVLGTAFVGPHALVPLPARAKAASASAQMYGRLDLLQSLLSVYAVCGGCPEGMGIQEVMDFAKRGVDMPDDKVRSAAVKVIAEVHRIEKSAGRELDPERYLGPVKPALLQVIQKQCAEGLAEIDGGLGGGGGVGGIPLATGIQIKTGKPHVASGSPSASRSGFPPIGGLPKLRGSINRSVNASLEISGKSIAGSAGHAPTMNVEESNPGTPSKGPRGKPPRQARPPPSRGGISEFEGADVSRSANGMVDSIMTNASPQRNPSPGSSKNLRASNLSTPPSKQGSFGSNGSRRSLRDGGPGCQIEPSVLDDADESLIMYIAGDMPAPGSVVA